MQHDGLGGHFLYRNGDLPGRMNSLTPYLDLAVMKPDAVTFARSLHSTCGRNKNVLPCRYTKAFSRNALC